MFIKKAFLFLLLFLSVYGSFAQEPKLVLPIGHTALIESAKFSSDGKRILTFSLDKTAKIWDVQTGRLLADMVHERRVNSAEFSQDGKMIVTASEDGTAKIWDANSGKLASILYIDTLVFKYIGTGPGNDAFINVSSAAFSPDGKNIVTISYDYMVRIWDVQTGKLLANMVYERRINSAEFSPDGKKVVIASYDNAAKVWDVQTGNLLLELIGHTSSINKAVFNFDGEKIITASDDSTAKVWDALSGNLLMSLSGHTGNLLSANFCPNDKKIVTTILDTTKIWDEYSGKLLHSLAGRTTYKQSAIIGPNKKIIVTIPPEPGYSVSVWDMQTGELLVELKGHTSFIGTAVFSPDGRTLVTTSQDKTIKIWSTQTGNLLFDLRGHTGFVGAVVFSPDGKRIVTSAWGQDSKNWDAQTGRLLHELTGRSDFINPYIFSPDGKKYVLPGSSYSANIWDKQTDKLLVELKGHTDLLWSTRFSSDGNKLATTSQDGTAKIWDVNTGRLIVEILGHISSVNSAMFSPDDRKIVTSSNDNTARIWDAQNGNSLTVLMGHVDDVSSAVFSPDGRRVATSSNDNTVKIWDAVSGLLQTDLKGHNSSVYSVQFSPDGKKVITASMDNTASIWNSETGKLLYTFFAVDSTDYFAQIPLGYYMASTGATKLLHYVTKDLKVITFEQLDVKYNRPDKVLEAIGNTDTALINSYRKAWEKRIKKLGIDTTAFRDGYSVPEADFANREAIAYEQTNGTLRLHIKGMDSTYKLDRFNVWVNEAPLFGQRGVSIKRKNSNSLDTTITIKLSQGENRIETSISNVNGTESYRMPLHVNYTPAVRQKETTRFIGIGIDQFSQSKYNLQYSTKDIRDLSVKLKEKYGNDIIIDTLFNENVTISNVKALKQKLQQTTENDKVIITYSGHGMLSKEYDYYLSTYNVNFDKPEENGLPYDELENLLDSIPARKKLMLIDACHSGEVDKDEQLAMNKTADSLGLKTKGVIVTSEHQQRVGLKNSFELMQSLFVNVGKSTGATIISAAAGNQYALEGVNNLPNGIFTYSIIEAMNKYPSMKINELKKIVGERVEQLTNGLQKPTSRNEAIAVDWRLW